MHGNSVLEMIKIFCNYRIMINQDLIHKTHPVFFLTFVFVNKVFHDISSVCL